MSADKQDEWICPGCGGNTDNDYSDCYISTKSRMTDKLEAKILNSSTLNYSVRIVFPKEDKKEIIKLLQDNFKIVDRTGGEF